ncbi:hypothetical protein N8841_04130 [Candidatus Pelagibacter sp.]|nr:hypothetical protein [Candidatus Pelagibacter sp.]
MRKLLSIIILNLYLSVVAIADDTSNAMRVLENCADEQIEKKLLKVLDEYKENFGIEAEIKFIQKSLEKIDRWIVFLEKEVELLDTNWDAHKKFYLENLESYKTQGLLSDRPYLSRINDKYLKTITGKLLEQDRLRGKLISTYFVDKEITTKQILSALEDNKRWQKEKREKIKYLLTNKGENELNAKLRKNAENTVSLFKSIIKLDVTEKIKTDKFTDALGSFSYVDFFRICETARMESPILFDTRFKD